MLCGVPAATKTAEANFADITFLLNKTLLRQHLAVRRVVVATRLPARLLILALTIVAFIHALKATPAQHLPAEDISAVLHHRPAGKPPLALELALRMQRRRHQFRRTNQLHHFIPQPRATVMVRLRPLIRRRRTLLRPASAI